MHTLKNGFFLDGGLIERTSPLAENHPNQLCRPDWFDPSGPADPSIGGCAHCEQLAKAKGRSAILLPEDGLGEWDRAGADLYNPEGLSAFLSELDAHMPANVEKHRLACHINDAAFADKALEIFDEWCADGTVSG